LPYLSKLEQGINMEGNDALGAFGIAEAEYPGSQGACDAG